MAHRKTVRHFHEVGHLHELTFSCYRRMPLLTNDVWREKLARSVEAAGKEWAMELVGFVFMPEHVHLLVYPTGIEPSISRYLARIKQPFSKQIKDILTGQGSRLLSKLTVRKRPGKECFRFWQEGPGVDRNLFSADAIGWMGLTKELARCVPLALPVLIMSACRRLEVVERPILPRRSLATTASRPADDPRFAVKGDALTSATSDLPSFAQ